MTTTIGPVKTALKVLWRATFDHPQTVYVTFGSRVVTPPPGASRLVIGNVTGEQQPEALGPSRTVQEDYDVECILSHTLNGTSDDQEDVTLALLDLYAGAEYAVRSHPGQDLGVPGVLWTSVEGRFELKEAPASETEGAINAAFTFNVHVRAMYRL